MQSNRILSHSRRRRGFTLIEIMLVVVIILTLVGLVGPRIAGRGREAKVAATKMQISNITTALNEFELHAGRYPTSEEGLEALIKRPSTLDEDEWKGPYLSKKKSVPADGWKKAFVYRYPSEHDGEFDIISAGPDGQSGTDDDISNIEE